MEIKEELQINKDGSGTFTAHYVFSKEFSSFLQMASNQNNNVKSELPVSTRQIENKFRGKGIRIEDKSVKLIDGRLNVDYKVTFDNLSDFAATQGFKERFQVYTKGNKLIFETKSKTKSSGGMNTRMPSQTLQTKPTFPNNSKGGLQDELTKQMMKESAKQILKDLYIEFSVILPNPIIDTNAKKVEGNKAIWIIDGKKLTGLDKSSFKKYAMPSTLMASCSIEGLNFSLPSEAPKEEKMEAQDKKEINRPLSNNNKKTYSTIEDYKKGGRAMIFFKNGNKMEVDSFRIDGDKIYLFKYGGTVGYPFNEIESIKRIGP